MFEYEMNGFMIIIIAICLIAAVCVAAVLLYSYAAGKQVRHLQNIDEQLDEEGIAVRILRDDAKEPQPFAGPDDNQTEGDDRRASCEDTVVSETPQMQMPEGEQVASGSGMRHIADMLYNVGRSGKMYTKEELEAQIKE